MLVDPRNLILALLRLRLTLTLLHPPRLRFHLVQLLGPLRGRNKKRNPTPNPITQHNLRNTLSIRLTPLQQPSLHPSHLVQELLSAPRLRLAILTLRQWNPIRSGEVNRLDTLHQCRNVIRGGRQRFHTDDTLEYRRRLIVVC